MQHTLPFSQWTFYHRSTKSTGIINNINDGCFLFSFASPTDPMLWIMAHWASLVVLVPPAMTSQNVYWEKDILTDSHHMLLHSSFYCSDTCMPSTTPASSSCAKNQCSRMCLLKGDYFPPAESLLLLGLLSAPSKSRGFSANGITICYKWSVLKPSVSGWIRVFASTVINETECEFLYCISF